MTISNQASGIRPGVCTSTTRPTAPYTGMTIYETDTGYLRVWDGSAWDYLSQSQDTTTNIKASDIGTWTNWTPIVYQGSTTFGLTVHYGKYCQINKLVIAVYGVTISNNTGTSGQSLSVALPVTAASGQNQAWGSSWIYDASAATAYNGIFYAYSSSLGYFAGDWSGGSSMGGTPATVFTTSDQIRGFMMYEAA